jgi:heme/copper-type cytochrome/quinol oxidase subunit 3
MTATLIPNSNQNRRYPPGDLAIWIFILAELLVFAAFFAAYAFMGLGRVRGWWRWPVLVWLFVPGSLIGAAFILAAA